MRRIKESGGEHQRLLDANREYQAEIRALKQELRIREMELDTEREKYQNLKNAYEKYIFEIAEKRERLEEMIRQYQDAINKIKALSKQYEAEAKAKIREITKVGKVV